LDEASNLPDLLLGIGCVADTKGLWNLKAEALLLLLLLGQQDSIEQQPAAERGKDLE
jgi:hypothetical protein